MGIQQPSCHSLESLWNSQEHWGMLRVAVFAGYCLFRLLEKYNDNTVFFTLTKAYSSRSSTFPCLHSSVTTCFLAPLPNPFVLQNIQNIRTSFGLRSLCQWAINKWKPWSKPDLYSTNCHNCYTTQYCKSKRAHKLADNPSTIQNNLGRENVFTVSRNASYIYTCLSFLCKRSVIQFNVARTSSFACYIQVL